MTNPDSQPSNDPETPQPIVLRLQKLSHAPNSWFPVERVSIAIHSTSRKRTLPAYISNINREHDNLKALIVFENDRGAKLIPLEEVLRQNPHLRLEWPENENVLERLRDSCRSLFKRK
ncbi:MAG: hypothetical protein G01um101425_878 [Candidatus Peregrinibacteria bacterium Gr01-1014_25]|nr:MAG: hypothetical protein G01um101425_878 [Candidatus Peregrinibacteria bacterium Gr01-1014_25]